MDDPGFLPFIRHDQYGELGGQPQPLSERLRQLLFIVLIMPFKVVGTLACLLSFFAACKLAWLIPAKFRSDVVAWLGKLHCRACLFCLGFISIKWVEVKEEAGGSGGSGGSVHRQGATPPAMVGPATPPGIVSNHTSWADIPLHMSRYCRGGRCRCCGCRWPLTLSSQVLEYEREHTDTPHSLLLPALHPTPTTPPRYFPAFVARDSTKGTPLIGIIRCAAASAAAGGPGGRRCCPPAPTSACPAPCLRSRKMDCIYVDRENGNQMVRGSLNVPPAGTKAAGVGAWLRRL